MYRYFREIYFRWNQVGLHHEAPSVGGSQKIISLRLGEMQSIYVRDAGNTDEIHKGSDTANTS